MDMTPNINKINVNTKIKKCLSISGAIKYINTFINYFGLCAIYAPWIFPQKIWNSLQKNLLYNEYNKLELEIENQEHWQEEEGDIYCCWALHFLVIQTKRDTNKEHHYPYCNWGSPSVEARVFPGRNFYKNVLNLFKQELLRSQQVGICLVHENSTLGRFMSLNSKLWIVSVLLF